MKSLASILAFALISSPLCHAAEADAASFATYDPSAQEADPKVADFVSPPMKFRPKTWWHWFNGMVSREGIQKDLQAMADVGIGGAQIFSLGEHYEKFHGDVRFGSPLWFETWKFVLDTAKPLGLEMGIHNCDGWTQSGGPWVTPASAMKKLVWTLTGVEGNGQEQIIPLDKPAAVLDYYEDIAVVAYPNRRPRSLAMDSSLERIDCFPEERSGDLARNLVDGNPTTTLELPIAGKNRPSGMVLRFSGPFKASSLVVLPGFAIAGKLELSVSDDGMAYRPVTVFDAEPCAQQVGFKEDTGRFWKLQALDASTVQPSNTYPFGKINLEFEEVELLQAGERSRVMPDISDLKRKAGLIGGFFSTYKPYRFTTGKSDEFAVSRDEIIRLKPDENGMVRWTVPQGRWTIMRAGMTTTGKTVEPATAEGAGLEVDKLNAGHVRMHLDAYAGKMIDAAGSLAGSVFKVIEVDSWESGILNWTQGWEEFFSRRNSYDLIDYLPVFANQTVESTAHSDRFLFDLRRSYAEALAYNYHDVIKSFCNRHGMLYESQSQGSHQFIHDAVLSFRHSDIPMTEGPFRGTETIRGKEYTLKRGAIEAASAGHLFGKRQVSREAYTSIDGNWSHTPFSYKRATDAAFNSGVNHLVFHTFAHQYDETHPGWQMHPWGTALNRKLTWWPLSRSWFEYLARSQYLLQQGRYDADILVFYGDDSPGIYHHSIYFDNDLLYRGNGRRFDVIDGDSLRRHLHVEDGRLSTRHGKAGYRILVVMKDRHVSLDSLRALRRLADEGAQVVIEDSRVLSFSPGLRDTDEAQYTALAKELTGGANGGKKVVSIGKGRVHLGYSDEEVLLSLGCKPAFSYETLSGKGDVNHLRRTFRDDEKVWYFISNHDRNEATEIIAQFRADAVPELWDPESGAVRVIKPLEVKDGMTKIKLELGPSDSIFVMFDRAKTAPAHHEVCERIESVELPPPYQVRFDPQWGAPESVVFDQLESWTSHPDEGIRHYSGIACYEKTFDVPQEWLQDKRRVWLEFDNLRDVAEIHLNDRPAGALWKPPYRVEITKFLKQGDNRLQVRVANTWVNRCLQDATLPLEQRLTWSNSMHMHFPDKSATDLRMRWDQGPLPSGIIGKVRLLLDECRQEEW